MSVEEAKEIFSRFRAIYAHSKPWKDYYDSSTFRITSSQEVSLETDDWQEMFFETGERREIVTGCSISIVYWKSEDLFLPTSFEGIEVESRMLLTSKEEFPHKMADLFRVHRLLSLSRR